MSFDIHQVSCWAFWKYNAGNVVSCVAISVDGSCTVAGTENGHVLLLDIQGNSIWSKSLGNEVEGVSISGDGNSILAGVAEYSTGKPDVFLLNRNGDIVWQKDLIQSGRPCGVCISQDSNYIATGDTDKRVRFFDSSGNQLWEKELGDWATSVSLSSTGVYLAAGSWDDSVYFFNRTGSQLWSYDTQSSVSGVSISPEGGYVASIGSAIVFFDGNGNQLWNKTSFFGDSVSVSVNGNQVAAGEKYDGRISVLNKAGGELWNWDVDSDVSSVAITGNGEFVIAGVEEGFVYFIENLQPTSMTCEVSKPKIALGEDVPVSGSISPPIEGAEVTLTFTKPDYSTVTMKIPTTAGGIYSGTCVPDIIGFWNVQAFWPGDTEHMGAESPRISFSVGESTITCEVPNWQIYSGESLTVSGSIDPSHEGVGVTLKYTDPEDVESDRTVTTQGDGNYVDTVTPNLEGMWTVQASWPGDTDTLASLSPEIRFLVSTIKRAFVKIGQHLPFLCIFEPPENYHYNPSFDRIVWETNVTSHPSINLTMTEGKFHYHEIIPGLGGTITSFEIEYDVAVLEGTSEGTYEATVRYDISRQSKLWPYSVTFLFRYELRCSIDALLKYGTSIDLSPPPQTGLGEMANVSGKILATGGIPVSFVNIALHYVKPDGITFSRTAATTADGSFQDDCVLDALGTWSVKAIWAGDQVYNGTESAQVQFDVLEELVHQATWDTGVHSVCTLSNSTVSDFFFNGSARQVGFDVSGLPDTGGFCNVTIPKALLRGYPWTILLNDTDWTSSCTVTENGTHSFIYVPYTHSSHKIQLIGTWVVPEFSSVVILAPLMITTLFAVLFSRRKRVMKL